MFNSVLFLFSLSQLKVDLVIALHYYAFHCIRHCGLCVGDVQQRKLVMIISEERTAIADAILHTLKRGATILKAEGAYSQKLTGHINDHHQ